MNGNSRLPVYLVDDNGLAQTCFCRLRKSEALQEQFGVAFRNSIDPEGQTISEVVNTLVSKLSKEESDHIVVFLDLNLNLNTASANFVNGNLSISYAGGDRNVVQGYQVAREFEESWVIDKAVIFIVATSGTLPQIPTSKNHRVSYGCVPEGFQGFSHFENAFGDSIATIMNRIAEKPSLDASGRACWKELQGLLGCDENGLGYWVERSKAKAFSDRVWQDLHANWFVVNEDEADVPHNWDKTLAKKMKYQSLLSGYLSGLVGRQPPATWLDEENGIGIHDTVKRLTGSSSRCYSNTGKYLPTLDMIPLILAAAEMDAGVVPQSSDWLEKVRFQSVPRNAVLPEASTMDKCKDAIKALHTFFRNLVKLDDKNGNRGNKNAGTLVRRFEFGADSAEIDFAIDCLKDESKHGSLLEQINNRPWVPTCCGETLSAYWDCRIAYSYSSSGDSVSKLRITLHPLVQDGKTMTRFTFRVKS